MYYQPWMSIFGCLRLLMPSGLSCQFSQAIWGTNISLFDSCSVKLGKCALVYGLISMAYLTKLLLVDTNKVFLSIYQQ